MKGILASDLLDGQQEQETDTNWTTTITYFLNQDHGELLYFNSKANITVIFKTSRMNINFVHYIDHKWSLIINDLK